MKTVTKYKSRKEILNIKKQNAKLYPIYKMFSWDLLFFYSIQYLFLTITKGVPAAQILKVDAFYPLFTMIMQVPAIICGDLLGRKNGIVLGNILMSLYIIILMAVPGVIGIFIANIIWAFGYSLKGTQETNLLYDSTATKGGEGIYPKINGRGASGYYILDGIASLIAGYLFVINGYLPMYMCLAFTIIATFISMGFKDIYKNELQEKGSIKESIKEYQTDFKFSIKAILKSKRLRALILFLAMFNSIINIMSTYKGNILTSLDVNPETFSILNAAMTLIAGISTIYQDKIHKKFRNKTLSILSMSYITSMIIIGGLLLINNNIIVLPITILLLTIGRITISLYYILSERYLKNFSTPKTRGRISFASETITNIIESICMFGAGLLLEATDIAKATLSINLIFLVVFLIILNYMKTRVGLKPEEYKKEDIELEYSK